MALSLEALRVIHLGLKGIDPERCDSQRILSLGYPDIVARPEELASLFGAHLLPAFRYRDDSARIARWHGMPPDSRIVDSGHFFAMLGYDLEVMDVVEARGGETRQDLNEPVPAGLLGRYALVADPGTLEHCFNIAQAAKNVAEMVAAGGCVFHGNPINMFNHGFYNLNPTWYHDFYAANGFKVEVLEGVVSTIRDTKVFGVPLTGRFANVPPEASLYVLARRLAGSAVRWPTQSKYVNNPTLKG